MMFVSSLLTWEHVIFDEPNIGALTEMLKTNGETGCTVSERTISHQPESIKLISKQAPLKPIETTGTQEGFAVIVTFGLLAALLVKPLYGLCGENLVDQSINMSVLQPLGPRL